MPNGVNTLMHTLRHWITLVETQQSDVFGHVSPGANLPAILKQGLVPNVSGGNYEMSYWEALPGVYVTQNPAVLHHHIMARDMTDHYLLVLVQVGGRTFVDEDKLDDLLDQTAQAVVRQHRIDLDELAEHEDELLPEIVAAFSKALGTPNPKVLAKYPNLLEEFVESWIAERIYGGDGPDPDYWPYAKDILVRAFQQMPDSGDTLRIPRKVGYRGATRILAVIEVTDGQARVVRGAIPPTAQSLVDGVTTFS